LDSRYYLIAFVAYVIASAIKERGRPARLCIVLFVLLVFGVAVAVTFVGLSAVQADWIALGTAAGSGGTDWVTRGIALGAAVVALASLAWNVISWRRQGAVVALWAFWPAKESRNHIQVIVNNRGRLGTRIEAVAVGPGPVADRHSPAFRTSGTQPGLPISLPAQTEVDFRITSGRGVRPLADGLLTFVSVRTGGGDIRAVAVTVRSQRGTFSRFWR
jgi:hypothetical protein